MLIKKLFVTFRPISFKLHRQLHFSLSQLKTKQTLSYHAHFSCFRAVPSYVLQTFMKKARTPIFYILNLFVNYQNMHYLRVIFWTIVVFGFFIMVACTPTSSRVPGVPFRRAWLRARSFTTCVVF